MTLSDYILDNNLITNDIPIDDKKELILFDYNFYKFFNDDFDKELILFAININPNVMQYINNDYIDNEIVDLLLTKSTWFIHYILGIGDDRKKIIFSKVPLAIQHISSKLSFDVLNFVMSIDGNALKFIKNQNIELVKTAITQTPNAIKYNKIIDESIEKLFSSLYPDEYKFVNFFKTYPISCYKTILRYDPILIKQFNKDELFDDVIIFGVTINPNIIRFIKNAPFEAQLEAVKQDGLLLEYTTQNLTLVIAAIKQNGEAIQFVQKKSLRLMYLAIMSNVKALDYIENPRDFLLDLALDQSALAIKYLDNPSYDELLNAVKRNGLVLEFIPSEFQTAEMQLFALSNTGSGVIPFITEPKSDDVLIEFIKYNPSYIFRIDEPSIELLKIAFSNAGELILHWNDWQSKFDMDMINTALNNDGSLLKYIDDPTVQQIYYAIESYPSAIKWIVGAQNSKIVMEAVKRDGKVIEFVRPDLLSEALFETAKLTTNLNMQYGVELIDYESFLKIRSYTLSQI